MAELRILAMDGVALAALEYPMACDDCNGLDPWTLVGGWRGMHLIEQNSRLLLALAIQAQTWARPSSAKALQEMRKELRIIRHTMVLSRFDRVFHWKPRSNALHAHTAAHSYYQMTEAILSLYLKSPSRLYTRLEEALWAGHTFTLRAASA